MDAPPAAAPNPNDGRRLLEPLRLLRWRSRTQAFVERVDGLELTMLRIPSGSIMMGSPEEEIGRDPDEGPQQVVTLGEFLMARTPITQAQWRTVASWTPRKGESWGRELKASPSRSQDEDARLIEEEKNTDHRPVESVSWYDAMEFCSRLRQRTGHNYTLPSEAQWEYACRAGSTTPFHFGKTITSRLANFRASEPSLGASEDDDWQQTTTVGLFPANPWGLQDMHGNVWEWCLDHWHETYSGAPIDGSAWLSPKSAKTPKLRKERSGTDNTERVVRGGAWSDPASDCRSSCRYRLPPAVSDEGIVGIRVACLSQRHASSTAKTLSGELET